MVDQFVSHPTAPTDDEAAPGTAETSAPNAPASDHTTAQDQAAPFVAPAGEWRPPEPQDGPSMFRTVAAIAGAILFVAGVTAWLFARSRRRASRRERAMDFARDSMATLPSRDQLERSWRRAAKTARRRVAR